MRRIIGWLVGVLLAVAAGTAAVGEQLAKARVAAATGFPLNQAASARRFLDGGLNPLSPAQSRALADAAYRASPLAGEAAVGISDRFYDAGEEARGLAVLKAAGSLGWHSELVQRVAYIRALDRGDYSEAANRAEALLRRRRARKELAADFAEAGRNNAAYRGAIVRALTQDAPWANGLLAEQGAQMPYPMLLEIFRARAAAGTPLDRQTAAPIIARLAIGGQFRQGAQLTRLMRGWEGKRLIPGWPSAAAEQLPLPYDWRLFEGYTPLPARDGEGFRLARINVPAARPAQVFLALEPGRYRLSLPDASATTLSRWRYGFACGRLVQRPITRLGASQVLDVPAGCETQVLSLGASVRAADRDGLAELSLSKIG